MDQGRRILVDIHQGIDSSLVILQHRLKASRVQLVKVYGELPAINCCIGQLNQVFINLIGNAIDALEMVNPPECKTGDETGRSLGLSLIPRVPTITIYTELQNDSLVIRIADNGQGIPAEIQDRLFEPFFTTKPVGKGTGLGLSISYHIIVEKHHGSFTYTSIVGEGTEFKIVLPLHLDPVSEEGNLEGGGLNSNASTMLLEGENRDFPIRALEHRVIA